MKIVDLYRIVGVIAAGAVALFVDLKPIYQVLMVMIAVDIITGAMRAFIQKELTAHIAFVGVMKKSGEVLLVGMCAYLQQVVPAVSSLPLPEAVALFYVYTEGVSVLENLAVIGVPIPDFLLKALKELAPDKLNAAQSETSGPMERMG